MGIVYEASRIEDNRRSAVKTVNPDYEITDQATRRLKREMHIIGELKHPNIVEYIENGRTVDLLWFASEYIEEGLNIEKEQCKREGTFPIEDAIEIMLQALDGLTFAHKKGIIHRDIKPSNILLAFEGESFVAKLGDFGLAKSLEQAHLNESISTKSGTSIGVLYYMPPEQLYDFENMEPPGDVFSVGTTLYKMLTRCPTRDYSDNQFEVTRQIADEATIPIRERDSSIPSELAHVIDKSLSMEPRSRYPDAGEFKEAIGAAIK